MGQLRCGEQGDGSYGLLSILAVSSAPAGTVELSGVLEQVGLGMPLLASCVSCLQMVEAGCLVSLAMPSVDRKGREHCHTSCPVPCKGPSSFG